MQLKTDTYNVGVIVGRFQLATLHEAHVELIQSVLKEHAKVLIFLGLSPVRGSISNPLDYQPRKQMLLEAFPPKEYPNITIGYINDMPSDEAWSKKLDDNIGDHLSPNDTVVLYGGRDSFLRQYKGRFPTRELVSTRYVSGTAIRKQLSEAPQSHPYFRAGAIWATYQRYPVTFPTVDIAVYDKERKELLLARKPDEILYRFVGGFVSPTDNSYEDAAARELHEETGLEAARPTMRYIGSARMNDWRYRNEVDKILTHLFLTYHWGGAARANDDIAEVKWFDIDRLTETDLVDTHRPLYRMLIAYLGSPADTPLST